MPSAAGEHVSLMLLFLLALCHAGPHATADQVKLPIDKALPRSLFTEGLA